MEQRRRRTSVWAFALLAGVVIGIVAVWFAMGAPEIVVVTAPADPVAQTNDWEVRDVPEPEAHVGVEKKDEDFRWKSQLLAAAGESGFAGDAGYRLIGSIKHDGGRFALAAAVQTPAPDLIALALDAGTNPFAMLAGSTKKWRFTIDGTITGPEDLGPGQKIDPFAEDPSCVMGVSPLDDLVEVKNGRLVNAVVIAERLDSKTMKPIPDDKLSDAEKYNWWRRDGDELSEVLIDACRFRPRVLVIRPDQQLKVTARDHTTFSVRLFRDDEGPSTAVRGDVRGPRQSHVFAAMAPGIYRVFDPNHSWMGGIVVSGWGAHAVTDSRGRFSIHLVEGDYRLRVVHEWLGEMNRIIHVDGDATHDFAMSGKFRDRAFKVVKKTP